MFSIKQKKMSEKQKFRKYTIETIDSLKKIIKIVQEVENLVDDLPKELKTFSPSPSRKRTGVSTRLTKELGLYATMKKLKSSVKEPLEDKIDDLNNILTKYKLKED